MREDDLLSLAVLGSLGNQCLNGGLRLLAQVEGGGGGTLVWSNI